MEGLTVTNLSWSSLAKNLRIWKKSTSLILRILSVGGIIDFAKFKIWRVRDFWTKRRTN